MSSSRILHASQSSFRQTFTFGVKDVSKWFPGHMRKGMQQMQSRLKNIDCLIEVHDARIPFSGRNPNFAGALAAKPHLLVLNKADLVDQSCRPAIREKLKQEGLKNVIFTDCTKQYDNVIKKKLVEKVIRLISSSDRFNRAESLDYNLMVLGVPNVGKSSLINALRRMLARKGRATRVGAVAGVTRSVLERIRVCDDPAIFLYDSPGILAPNVKDLDTGMKLALCATLQDHLVGEEIIVDYMLYHLNKQQCFSYVQEYNLPGTTDELLPFLVSVAKDRDLKTPYRSPSGGTHVRPDVTSAAKLVLRHFREGRLGRVVLDNDVLGAGVTEVV